MKSRAAISIFVIFAGVFPLRSLAAEPAFEKGKTNPENGKSPAEIRKYFTDLGNTKTAIGIGKMKLYSPLNLKGYMDFVDEFKKRILTDGDDGVNLTDAAGRRLVMIPVAGAFFTLKAPECFPEADAALAYILTDGGKYVGVFLIGTQGQYLALLKETTAKVECREATLGVEMGGNFVRFIRVEFDLPTKK